MKPMKFNFTAIEYPNDRYYKREKTFILPRIVGYLIFGIYKLLHKMR